MTRRNVLYCSCHINTIIYGWVSLHIYLTICKSHFVYLFVYCLCVYLKLDKSAIILILYLGRSLMLIFNCHTIENYI